MNEDQVFYCENLDYFGKKFGKQKPSSDAVKGEWGWICECGAWYDPDVNIERRLCSSFIDDEIGEHKWVITPTKYNKHKKINKEI